MTSNWRAICPDSSADSTWPLLVKYDLSISGYTIWLSDLSDCWVESLDRRQIIRRAFETDTSVDPSEGVDQFRLFLKCLQDALAQRDGARLTLRKRDANEIVLEASAPLPGPLAPLVWVFTFSKDEKHALTDQVIMPLLDQRLLDSAAISSLMSEIKHKDKLISRLMETIQSDGFDLMRLFPSAQTSKANAKAYSRQVLGRSVKGMREFDLPSWESELAQRSSLSQKLPDLVSDIFPEQCQRSGNSPAPLDLNTWQKIAQDSTKTLSPEEDPSRSQRSFGDVASNIGDSFEVSDTRWHGTLTKIFPSFKKKPHASSNTDKPPSQSSNSQLPIRIEQAQPTSSVGKISEDADSTTDEDSVGNRTPHFEDKQPGPEKSVQSSWENSRPDLPQPSKLPEKSVQSSWENLRPDLPRPSKLPPAEIGQNPKSDGQISSHSKADPDDTSQSVNTTPKKGKIGRIGGKKVIGAPLPSSQDGNLVGTDKIVQHTIGTQSLTNAGAHRPPTLHSNTKNDDSKFNAAAQPEAQETSQERANKKRVALKHELETKAQNAGKKKRRF